MSTNTISLADANTLITAARTGRGIDAIEQRYNTGLSSLIDELWDRAEREGKKALAGRLERAYNDLVG